MGADQMVGDCRVNHLLLMFFTLPSHTKDTLAGYLIEAY